MRRSLIVLAALATATAPAAVVPASAQDFSMMSNFAQQNMLNDNLRRNLGNATRGTAAPRRPLRAPRATGAGSAGIAGVAPRPPAPVGPIAGASTSYRPSPEVTRRVRGQFVAFIRKTDGPEAAARIEAELERQDYLQVWARHASEDGLRLGDVADAMAAYWVQNWQVVKRIDYAQPAHVRAVRDQVRRTLLSNPSFARLTDAQKQEMAEVFIYNQSVQGAAFAEASKRGDQGLLQKLQGASVARFRSEMNVDLRRLDLTDHGFVPG